MKNLVYLLLIVLLFSCREARFDEVASVTTTIAGKATNPTTGLPIPNTKLTLKREWKQNCGGFSTCSKEEKIAEITTDSNGEYRFEFGYLPANGRSMYTYTLMPSDSEFRFDKDELNNIVEPGQLNEINFSIWKPIKLDIKVKVLNNNVPPLYIEVTDLKNNNFSNWSFNDQNGQKTFDFLVRPNTDLSVSFIYIENYNTPTAKSHKIDFPYKSTFAESTTINYTIDFATF